MHLGFTGEYQQKVDGKGRMSIPADFRRVLEDGDAIAKTAGTAPGLYVLYGPHLKGRLAAQTVAEFTRVVEAISAIQPKSKAEAEAKRLAQVTVIGHAVRLDVDKDGRVVLPQRQREKLGLTEGEVMFIGLGDAFEIWPAATYQTEVADRIAAQLEALGDDHDPMTAVWGLVG